MGSTKPPQLSGPAARDGGALQNLSGLDTDVDKPQVGVTSPSGQSYVGVHDEAPHFSSHHPAYGHFGLGIERISSFMSTNTDDSWTYPFSASASQSMRKSNSVRSVRSFDFEGNSLTPLPSPMIPPQDSNAWPETYPKDSKTDAFFNSVTLSPTPPKPPQNIARSASSRVPVKKDAGTAHETVRRRHRALSSPQRFDEREHEDLYKPPTEQPLLTTPVSTAVYLQSGVEPWDDLSRPRITSTTTKHIHGPSMHINTDSIDPLPKPHSPTSQDEKHTREVNEALLKSMDNVTEEEDESAGRVGPYKTISLLGTGAFSKVLLAKPVSGSNHARVALKMIACEPWKVNERMRVSWVREAEILKRISHPCIVGFISAFRTPKHYTLVLDAVPGSELFELLAQHQLQVAQREWLVRRIFGELANAVHWMHSINLVHRDIKLENIMLTHSLFASQTHVRPGDLGPVPLIKVTDFGLARFVKEDQLLETRCGSEEYAAPELILGKKYDGRKTDAWAIGVVLYAMLTGAIPFLLSPPQDTAGSESAQQTGMMGSRERNGSDGHDARERKAHLLRIVKGELQWPDKMNDACQDVTTDGNSFAFDPSHRLVTPQARHITSRFLRRDPKKRASCIELWQDPWFLYGSFATPNAPSPQPFDDATMLCTANEASADYAPIALPHSPADPSGKVWLSSHATSTSCAEPVVHHELM